MTKENFILELQKQFNFTETENGAISYKSTSSGCLDAFGSLAAMRTSDDRTILTTFYKALYENKELAMRLLFYVRDIREGQGMRRIFRVIVKDLASTYPKLVIKNLDNFLYFGRGDDLLCLLDTEVKSDVVDFIYKTIKNDLNKAEKGEAPSLLAKWLPSENTSSRETNRLANILIKSLGISPKKYRKTLSFLRNKINIVEAQMSKNDWDAIKYENVPSKASLKYSNAFYTHSEDKYLNYLKAVAVGDSKINSKTLFPSDIVSRAINLINCYKSKNYLKDCILLDTMWSSLPNWFEGRNETGICVVDTSGSMYGTPMNVAISLGIYCADKCTGPYKGKFITFSSRPALQSVVGETIVEKVRNLQDADWEYDTNLEAVFNLILKTAIRTKAKQSDIPGKIYIISDMQFNSCVCNSSNTKTLMQKISEQFAAAGYDMPAIVYWNVRASRCGMFQDDKYGDNICFVSGYSPSLFRAVIDGTDYVEETVEDDAGNIVTVKTQHLDPMNVMMTTLLNERYDRVVVD